MKYMLWIFLLFSSIAAYGQDKPLWTDIYQEISAELSNHILDPWYPTILDTIHGGYLSNLDQAFQPMPKQDKMIVTQARHLWVTSKEAVKMDDRQYLEYARQGYLFLQKMWDASYGGFYQLVDQTGTAKDGGSKTAYGNAFAIYGLSAYYAASGDESALQLAKNTFHWLDLYSHDTIKKGYFQDLSRQGERINSPERGQSLSKPLKDQNSSIHLLEAFTELYHVWPDATVKNRLSEMYFLIKDVMVNEEHYLNLFFDVDLNPISLYRQSRDTILKNAWIDHVSFGHDIETAFLLIEAAEALGLYDHSLPEELKPMVDHALLGWDDSTGGIFDQGFYFDHARPVEIIKRSKQWWAQAEALNTLLIFHQLFPRQGYDKYFFLQWEHIKNYLIDSQYGGWYIHSIDTRPEAINSPKASIWKSTYHNYRALDHCQKILQGSSDD